MFQEENVALRLIKEHQGLEEIESSPSFVIEDGASEGTASTNRQQAYFDEAGYVTAGSKDLDPYVKNRFNQAASDALPSNRAIPDTRNAM